MSPILGIFASAQQSALLTNSYESIATTTVGAGGASTVTFSSIPSTYKHLQIRAIAHSNYNSSPGLSVYLNFNSDTGANYSSHFVRGNGATASVSNDINAPNIALTRSIPDTNANSSMMGGLVIDLLEYKNTNIYKTIRSLCGYDTNNTTSGNINLYSGNWRSTSAISTIAFTTDGSFLQYSQFALYGIKG